MSDIILKTEGLTKHYGGVHALNDADFELQAGEHVAIMGDNGAGKSTFVRQITGVEQRTRGKMYFMGKAVDFAGPLDAREAGIETVFQTLALADDLDVPSNLFLGREKILFNLGPFSILDKRGMRKATEEGLKKTAVKIPNINNPIRNMSGGQPQGWPSPVPRHSIQSSPSWMNRLRHWVCRKPRRWKTLCEHSRRLSSP